MPIRPAIDPQQPSPSAAPALHVPAQGGPSFDFGGLGAHWKIDAHLTGGRFSVVHHPLAPRALAAQWPTFWNAGDEPCHIIEVISPGGFEDYFDFSGPSASGRGALAFE